ARDADRLRAQLRHRGRHRMSPLFLLSGCGWNHLPHQDATSLDEPLWDARGVVPTVDGLYVPLPSAGALALVAPGEDPVRVDVGEGRVTRVDAAPDGRSVLAFV